MDPLSTVKAADGETASTSVANKGGPGFLGSLPSTEGSQEAVDASSIKETVIRKRTGNNSGAKAEELLGLVNATQTGPRASHGLSLFFFFNSSCQIFFFIFLFFSRVFISLSD